MIKITKTEYTGMAAVEVKTSGACLVVVTEYGPRIAHFGKPSGRNLLFWDAKKERRRGDWVLGGGHRVWNTRPGGDEAEETYATDNAACNAKLLKDGIVVSAPATQPWGMKKSLTVRATGEAQFEITNTIENASDMLWSGGVWSLTCTQPKKGVTYGVPLGDHSAWDCFAMIIPRAWGGHSAMVADPQISLTQDCLILNPRGIENKRMLQAPQGVIGMTDPAENVSFLKRTKYVRGAAYPLNTNLAFFVGPKNFMVEMEAMGPESTVKPGEKIELRETWQLTAPVDWKKLKGPLPA